MSKPLPIEGRELELSECRDAAMMCVGVISNGLRTLWEVDCKRAFFLNRHWVKAVDQIKERRGQSDDLFFVALAEQAVREAGLSVTECSEITFTSDEICEHFQANKDEFLRQCNDASDWFEKAFGHVENILLRARHENTPARLCDWTAGTWHGLAHLVLREIAHFLRSGNVECPISEFNYDQFKAQIDTEYASALRFIDSQSIKGDSRDTGTPATGTNEDADLIGDLYRLQSEFHLLASTCSKMELTLSGFSDERHPIAGTALQGPFAESNHATFPLSKFSLLISRAGLKLTEFEPIELNPRDVHDGAGIHDEPDPYYRWVFWLFTLHNRGQVTFALIEGESSDPAETRYRLKNPARASEIAIDMLLLILARRPTAKIESERGDSVHLNLDFTDVENPYLGLRTSVGKCEWLLKREGYQNSIDFSGQPTRWSVICALVEARENGAENELLAGSTGNFDVTKLRLNRELKSLGVAIRKMPRRTGWSLLTNLTSK